MKAYVLHGINDLHLEEKEMPYVPDGWVLVKVKAAGICGSDIPRIYKTGAHRHPIIPGHEFSGKVAADRAAGADVTDWDNKRVGIFPLIPCGECDCCKQQKYEMCSHYNYLGSRCDGGFAEYVAVPKWNLIELPDQVSYEAAAMLEPMAVAVHAMRSAGPGKEESVAVCGLGTIGLLLVMFLQQSGIKHILAIGNKDFQRQCISQIGKNIEFIDMRSDSVHDCVMNCTNGRGVDVFFECVGKNETLIQAIDVTAPGGKIQLIGNPYTDMHLEKSLYWNILRHQLTLLGTWNSSFTRSESDDWHFVLDCLKNGSIHPELLITHRLPMDQLEVGLTLMRDKTEDFVKVLCFPEQTE